MAPPALTAARSVADVPVLSEDLYERIWEFLERVRPAVDKRAGLRATSWLGELETLEALLQGSVMVEEDGSSWEYVPMSRAVVCQR